MPARMEEWISLLRMTISKWPTRSTGTSISGATWFLGQALYYLRFSISSTGTIDLCIVDIATFPEGVFLPDMDLIHAYRSFDENLRDLEDLRRKKHRNLRRILLLWRIPVAGCTENRRQVPNHFSAGNHRPEVVSYYNPSLKARWRKRRPTWANEVVRLREAFYQNKVDR